MIGFKIASPILDAHISDFVMLITFVMVPAASLHKLAQSSELGLAEQVGGDMLEFKVCTQVKSDNKLEEKSMAYQLGLSLTESVCNLRTYLKLAQFNVEQPIVTQKLQKQAKSPTDQVELIITHNGMPIEESSIMVVNESN